MVVLGEFDTSVKKALSEIDKNWEELPGLVICGTHKPNEFDTGYFIVEVEVARKKNIPFLGLCFGHQIAVIEYARNVLGIEDATSEEFGEGTFVVKKLPEMKVGGYYKDGSRWNNYEVVIDWEKPDNFFTSQGHPEYESSIDKPHPLLVSFIEYAKLAM